MGFLILPALSMLLAVVLLLLFSYVAARGRQGAYTRLPPELAAERLRGDEGALLIDLRTDPEDLKVCAIDGAVHIALRQLEGRIGRLAPDLDRVILLVCDTGLYSRAGALLLLELGYRRVYDAGGACALKQALEACASAA
ncbi:MAG: rhodanese-like domain-containing protein [Clostridiales bacterium]|nr:rhodanese-like domain-containing protein [Clostridiales bacterium]